MEFMTFLANLNYAFIDFLFVGAMLYFVDIRSKHNFRKEDQFMILTLGVALAFFFVSNMLQDGAVSFLSSFEWYWGLLLLIFLSTTSLSFLVKFMKEKNWNHKLVKYPLMLASVTVLVGIIIAWRIYF